MAIVAIRGATTLEQNSIECVREGATQLFFLMLKQNNICPSQIISAIISSTNDITAFYPATAIRESSIECEAIPFFSCVEPQIENALPLCVRVLLTINTDNSLKPNHIYLKGAKNLRKKQHFNIAIDGPSGAGKSTAARILAQRLGIAYLDTGAMYRAAALHISRVAKPPYNEQNTGEALKSLMLDIDYINGEQHMLLNGQDVSELIRSVEVGVLGNELSCLAVVRQELTARQREIAQALSCVLDGRDIGTVVLKDAKYKFFLTANPNERAMRRTQELQKRGQNVSFEAVLNEILARDLSDTSRKLAPLKQAEDAVLIDSSGLSANEVAGKMIEIIDQKNKSKRDD